MAGEAPLRDLLHRLDDRGRFDQEDLSRVRAVVSELSAGRGPDHPADVFGPWAGLPEAARSAFRGMAAADVSAGVRLWPWAAPWAGAVRALREADHYLAERRPAGVLRRACVWGAERVHNGPFNAWRKAQTALARRRFERGSVAGPADLVAGLGRDARWLFGDFVEGVPLPVDNPGFWDDPRRGIVFGYLIGLDLLPTRDGICFVEANLRTMQSEKLYRLPWLDRLPPTLMDFAKAHGARRVVVVQNQLVDLDHVVLSDLWETAAAHGIGLEVLQDPTVRPVRGGGSEGWVGRYRRFTHVPHRTLVLQRRSMPSGPDFVISNKEPSLRALSGWLREATGPHPFFILPMSAHPMLARENHPGLPNVVYKYPDRGAGQGVHFMRARDAAHAVELARALDGEKREPPGLFQPFAPVRLLEGRRVYDVRADILITPRRVVLSSAFRRESTRPVPERVEEGRLRDLAAYASNIARGGRFARVPDEEVPAVEAAALAVGEALRQVLNRTFVTRPYPGGAVNPEPRAPRRVTHP